MSENKGSTPRNMARKTRKHDDQPLNCRAPRVPHFQTNTGCYQLPVPDSWFKMVQMQVFIFDKTFTHNFRNAPPESEESAIIGLCLPKSHSTTIQPIQPPFNQLQPCGHALVSASRVGQSLVFYKNPSQWQRDYIRYMGVRGIRLQFLGMYCTSTYVPSGNWT